jgi:hypothetical protein
MAVRTTASLAGDVAASSLCNRRVERRQENNLTAILTVV